MSSIDLVVKHNLYFHPIGGSSGGWPKQPPNYIGFRYDGRLQSIHHIEDYEVFTDPNRCFAGIPAQERESHFLYRLGPAFAPAKPVKTGKLWSSGRVWCMLDTLFTEDTISDAIERSRQRAAQMV